MISDRIKVFIQENKQLIQNNEWDRLFWQYYHCKDICKVESNFTELIYTFHAANIDVDMSARRFVIYDETVDNIKWLCEMDPNIDYISYRKLWQELYCSLGYTIEQLKQIFNEAAMVCDFEPNKGNTGVVRLTN
jgi:hypothetical protein